MPTLVLVDRRGNRTELNAKNGESILSALKKAGAVKDDCGGELECTACHIVLGPMWYPRLSERAPGEWERILTDPNHTATSRLSCQIEMSDALDGIVVHRPPVCPK